MVLATSFAGFLMRLNLQFKLWILLLVVMVITLSSAVLVRNLLVRDFNAYAEGQALDRLYQTQAILEGYYQQKQGWDQKELADIFAWAWLDGLDLRLLDNGDQLILSSAQALELLPSAMQQRVLASAGRQLKTARDEEFQPYPLFLAGIEIGTLEAALTVPDHENLFISSSNKFLTYSVVTLGCISILLSVVAAKRISDPLRKLTLVAEDLADGHKINQVQVGGNDEISRLASSFNKMAGKLKQQEQLRKQLVSNAAHELRTPLMIMQGELEGMLDQVIPVSDAALQSLLDETARLGRILDGVDELTRAQTATLMLNRQQIKLIPFLQNLLLRFEHQTLEQQIKTSIIGDTELTASIDPELFARIIINLVTNAFRAMPSGGSFSINVNKTGNNILFELADTGTGIEAELLPNIFERFSKGKKGGLGLGLAIVKELVEAHDGLISVESETGKGTKFQIVIPDMVRL